MAEVKHTKDSYEKTTKKQLRKASTATKKVKASKQDTSISTSDKDTRGAIKSNESSTKGSRKLTRQKSKIIGNKLPFLYCNGMHQTLSAEYFTKSLDYCDVYLEKKKIT